MPCPSLQVWNVLGLCLVSLGDSREGVAAYRQAVALKPDYSEVLLKIGQVCKEEGNVQESEEALKKVSAWTGFWTVPC
jgi:cytochrome c-type biogenesis protein CcmH/NrfG